MSARLIAAPAVLGLAGCTPQQAAPYGEALFGLMIVFLIATPIVFYRAWRRRRH